MTPDVLAALKAELSLDEGVKFFVYDDATGHLIAKGSVVQGNPTIAIGRNLAARGLSQDEIAYLFANDAAALEAELAGALPWLASLSIPRQVAMYSLYFNLDEGNPAGFLRAWPNFIAQMQAGEYDAAADNLETSQPWATQVGARSKRLGEMVRSG
jgi:lysozyme